MFVLDTKSLSLERVTSVDQSLQELEYRLAMTVLSIVTAIFWGCQRVIWIPSQSAHIQLRALYSSSPKWRTIQSDIGHLLDLSYLYLTHDFQDIGTLHEVSLIRDSAEIKLENGTLRLRRRGAEEWSWFYYEKNHYGDLDWTKEFEMDFLYDWQTRARRFHFKYKTNSNDLPEEYILVFRSTPDAATFITCAHQTKKHFLKQIKKWCEWQKAESRYSGSEWAALLPRPCASSAIVA